MRILIAIALVACSVAAPLGAQTASTATAARTAYGARMAQPEGIEVNSSRVNSRINNRINSRLATRIERYSPVQDPTASLRRPAIEPARKAIEQPLPQQEDAPN